MKLKVFDTTTVISPRNQKNPALTIHRKGSIRFNRSAVDKLKLQEGEQIAFVQDEEDPSNWYLTRSDKGWKVRKLVSNEMIIQSSLLVATLLPFLQIESDAKSKSVLFAGQPVMHEKKEYYGILLPLTETE